MDRIARDRLKWKCRRGLLELDLVLERFLRTQGAEMGDTELEMLTELLDTADPELWDIVSGRTERYDPRFAGLVARLRAS